VLANAAMPYILGIANSGLEQALRSDPGLAAGVYAYGGKMVNRKVAKALGLEAASLEQMLREGQDS